MSGWMTKPTGSSSGLPANAVRTGISSCASHSSALLNLTASRLAGPRRLLRGCAPRNDTNPSPYPLPLTLTPSLSRQAGEGNEELTEKHHLTRTYHADILTCHLPAPMPGAGLRSTWNLRQR